MRLLIYIAVAALLGTCSSPPALLDQILELGELRVVTRDSPSSYVIGPDGPSGPEFDLVQAFADELGVSLILESVASVSEIVPRVLSGKSHMAAAGLSITRSRQTFLNFSHPYQTVDMQLIYKVGTGKPRRIEDLAGRSIEVLAASSHSDMMATLGEIYPEIDWIENADATVGDLLAKVAAEELEFTIADSTEFNIQRNFHPDLRVAIELETDGLLAQVHDRYYGHTKKFDYVGTRNFIRHFESRLPRYRGMFEQAGSDWDVDWRLLAAIGYQESHWRSQAVSPTGVRGIMMLTQDTAAYLGIDDRVNPKNSIFGGAQFFARQTQRIADTVDEPDRTWMALAAYNVGFNHIKDARLLVDWHDGNPDTWLDISKALPLLSQRKWYSQLQFGYARGWEPVLYVNNIRSYYNILKWLTENEVILEDDGDEAVAAN